LAEALDRQGGASRAPLEIADFGCGNERLRLVLNAKLGRAFDYRGYDLRPQSSTVEYLDVGRELPRRSFDVIFCLGLVEYVPDVEALAQRLKHSCARLIVSYMIADPTVGLARYERRARGWRHSHTREGIEMIFKRTGFVDEGSLVINGGLSVVWSWAAPTQPGRSP
jgi:hypothetical protein